MPISAESREKFIKAELRQLSEIFKEVVNAGNSLIKDGLAYRVIWDDLNEVFCLQTPLVCEDGWDTIFVKLPELEDSFR